MTYLLTWNPERSWEHFEDSHSIFLKHGFFESDWSCGSTRNIQKGDRFFHVKLGRRLPVGIFGSGRILCSPYESEHWEDKTKVALYIDIRYDMLLNAKVESILELSTLRERLPDVHWTPQASGMSITPESSERLEELWALHLEDIGYNPSSGAEEIVSAERFYEGSYVQVNVNAYERNACARAKALKIHGCACEACGLKFEEKYGYIGKDFIHFHHVKPLSEIGEEYEIQPEIDLIPLCPNCHAMIHRHDPPYTSSQLKDFLAKQQTPSMRG